MNKIFIIVGPSGAGKGSITSALVDDKTLNLVWAKTATTRAPREDDKKLSRHEFVSADQFKKMVKNGEILEFNIYQKNYYGTLRNSVEKILKDKHNVLLEIDINGAKNIKNIFGKQAELIFVYATKSELEKRLRKRKMDDKVIAQRLNIAEKELQQRKYCDHTIHNIQNKLDVTINKISQIIRGELEK